MKKLSFILSVAMLALLLFSIVPYCFSAEIKTNYPKNGDMLSKKAMVSPEAVFDQVWQLLNSNYPFFDQQGIDWKSIYKVYRPKISGTTSDDELFTILCNMLEHFNDGHINLETGEKRFCSNIRVNPKMEDFNWKLVRDKYLNKSYKSSPDSLFFYGWLTNDFAYLRVRRFPAKEILEKYIDDIIGELNGAKGMVVDIRGNPGGNGFGVAALGSRFADRKRLYMKNFNRIGGMNKEYVNPTYYYIEPLGPVQYKGPVVLLQNVYSESGSDDFALAMRVLSNVTSVGESTGGCFSTYYPEKLVNGWTLSMPFSYAVDQNDFCWESIGVPPDLRKINKKEDIDAGIDKVLEFALDILKVGGHFGKPADGSLKEMRISLVDQFIATAAARDVGSSVQQFEESLKKYPDRYYFSIQELGVKVKALLQAEKNEEAFALLQLGEKAFPQEPNILYFLARLYENLKNQPEKAKPLWERLAAIQPSFPWERNVVAEAKKSLGKN
jgi:carboxyl-terminal processing protease